MLNQNNIASWQSAFQTYTHPRVRTLFFFGFSAGLPFLLIFGTLSLWLKKAEVDTSTITYFSWAALGYSFKFVWAPLMDRLPLPVLDRVLGRRRSWLLLAQILIVIAIFWMALTEPKAELLHMAYAAVLLGFAAASQDIVIDAFRIEAAAKQYQAAMSAMYTAGYRTGMLLAGAGAFYLVAFLGTDNTYVYAAWKYTYLIMAAFMLIGIATTLIVSEPERNKQIDTHIHSTLDYLRFLLLFAITTITFILSFVYLSPVEWLYSVLHGSLGMDPLLSKFVGQLLRLLLAGFCAISAAYVLVSLHIVNKAMVIETYIAPFVDFVRRYRHTFIIVLLLIGFYRVADVVLGAVAIIFYDELGFSEIEIATISKTFGLIMIVLGGFVGGVLTARYGVLRILLLGSILAAATNILFMIMVSVGHNALMLTVVIAADNLSAGLAGTAFIAYLSGLTNISFTAMQYAIFSSVMTLFPKLISGYSGSMVENIGYQQFFLLTTLMGVPVILLILYLIRHDETINSTST